MFDRVSIPVLGIVENMNAFVCSSCSKVTHVFGEKGASNLAKELSLPLLGSVPLDPDIMTAADEGKPLSSEMSSEVFKKIAEKVKTQLF